MKMKIDYTKRKCSGITGIFVILMMFLFVRVDLQAQVISQDQEEKTLEKLAENSTVEADLSDHAADLEYLRNHPVNLNNVTFPELNQLTFLSDIQINNLFLYIQAYGALFSTAELSAIEGFDSVTVNKILPYVTLGKPAQEHKLSFNGLFHSGRQELIVRYQQVLQNQKGYTGSDSLKGANPEAVYLGSRQKFMFRYKYTYYDRLSIGIAGEKDPGEQFFKGNQLYGMDFYSGYLALKNTGILKTLILGNFRADFGQGLVIGNGLSFLSFTGITGLRKVSGGIRPALSVNETGYLRGVASALSIKNIDVSIFYSTHRMDATPLLTDTSTGTVLQASSIGGSGLHRLPSEIENKNSVREQIVGGNISFRGNRFLVGITSCYSHWSTQIRPRSDPYNRFVLSGNENLNAGLDFQVSLRRIYLFGEGGRSMNGGVAWLLGAQFIPGDRLSFSLLLRDYQKNYQDLAGNAYGQNGLNANERGILVSLTARPFAGFTVFAFADLFQFPWLKYQVDGSSDGYEYQVQGDYSVGHSVLMRLRLRMNKRNINNSESEGPIHQLGESKSLNIRYQLDWNLAPSWQLKSRLEYIKNMKEPSYNHAGYMMCQGLSFKPAVKPVSVTLLYTLFDTDSYNERIYNYENDVLFGYSIPAYYGKGIRINLLIEWSPWKRFTLWIKYANTYYADRNTIGTGLDQIDGHNKSDLTCQVRFRL
jgi:hypothetical protein